MSEFELRSLDGGRATELPLRAQPGASRARVVGIWNGKLKVAVTAPPDKGRANDELLRLLAELCGVRASALTLVAGERSRDKRIRIALAPEVVRAALLQRLD